MEAMEAGPVGQVSDQKVSGSGICDGKASNHSFVACEVWPDLGVFLAQLHNPVGNTICLLDD